MRRTSLATAALLLAVLACGDSLPPALERAIPAELPQEVRESQRRLPVAGAANLRELGGYLTRDGRALRWGVLYRSDALADLSDQDVAYLERLRLHRVVDFRSAAERERDPDRLPDGVTVVWQPIAGQGLDPGQLQDRLLAGEVSADQAAAWLVDGNRAFVNEFREVYARFLRDLANPANLPTLFHCTAGKDRTGFAAALVLLALGVPRETAMRDYLLTNTFTQEKTRRTLQVIRLASLFRADPDDLQPLFEARESYLGAAFSAIEETPGATDAYLRDALGIDDALRDRLRANLLEPPPAPR
jgi:protein-tyrosine phosphatase